MLIGTGLCTLNAGPQVRSDRMNNRPWFLPNLEGSCPGSPSWWKILSSLWFAALLSQRTKPGDEKLMLEWNGRWRWPLQTPERKRKRASQWQRALLVLCASAPSNSNKGAFPTFKRPLFAFNKGWTAVAIKHMVLRHWSFVPLKPLRY